MRRLRGSIESFSLFIVSLGMMAILLSLLTALLHSILMATVDSGQTLSTQSLFSTSPRPTHDASAENHLKCPWSSKAVGLSAPPSSIAPNSWHQPFRLTGTEDPSVTTGHFQNKVPNLIRSRCKVGHFSNFSPVCAKILGNERQREEERDGRESKPLMSKTFFVKRRGLALKYSGWQ